MQDNMLSYCVIGDPVQHSLSPMMHMSVFQRLELPFHYEAVHVKPDDLKTFVLSSRRQRPGFNVTIPHKQSILSYLDKIDSLAQHVGAVNTVKNIKGSLVGFNTDVAGFKNTLARFRIESVGKTVILGAGGACRAAVAAICGSSSEVVIFDVNHTLAQTVQSDSTESDG